MMLKLVPIFITLTLFLASYSKIVSCQTITCGNNSFYIQYPFHLTQQQSPKHHHHHQFELKCNIQGFAVLNLPFSGDFYVRDIDYFRQMILLYDPGNCLSRRLMNLSLSSSPFSAMSYHNYTFFSCPTELMDSHNLTAIMCLSNSTASILAAPLGTEAVEIKNLSGCHVFGSFQIPVSTNNQSEYNGFDGDLELSWIDPGRRGGNRRISFLGIMMICFITISLALLGALFCIGCCMRFTGLMLDMDHPNIRRRAHRFADCLWDTIPIRSSGEARSSVAEPSRRQDQRLFNADSGTEMLIIGGRQSISGPNNETCPICLEEYQASERVRRICRCDHCFHASCLERWLEKETTCPVCRILVK